MKYTKCSQKQFFTIYPPCSRQSFIMAPNEEPEVINHGSLVLCDSCNQEMYNDDNFKEGYLLLEVEGYPTQRLLCKDCFERWKGYGKEANDNELKELTTRQAILYLNNGYDPVAEFDADMLDNLSPSEEELERLFNEKE